MLHNFSHANGLVTDELDVQNDEEDGDNIEAADCHPNENRIAAPFQCNLGAYIFSLINVSCFLI